jgi:hypothetical protein
MLSTSLKFLRFFCTVSRCLKNIDGVGNGSGSKYKYRCQATEYKASTRLDLLFLGVMLKIYSLLITPEYFVSITEYPLGRRIFKEYILLAIRLSILIFLVDIVIVSSDILFVSIS